MRSAARRRGDLGGTLDQVRAALDQALAAERDTLAGEDGDDARLAEMELATLPDDTAGAVRALADYDWHSPEARATYESIQQMLRQRGARRPVRRHQAGARATRTPRRCRPSRTCSPTSTRCWPRTPAARTPTDQFREFMDKHGDLFPENPQNVDELIDALARRQAAAERMMASLSPEQREQLGPADERRAGRPRPGLADGAALGQPAGAAARAGPGGRSSMRQGGESLGYSDAVEAVAELADLEALEQQLAQGHPGATLDDVDVEHAGAAPRRRRGRATSRRCASWSASSSGRATCPAATTACG